MVKLRKDLVVEKKSLKDAVCNAYISKKQQWLSTANDIVTND